MRGTMRLIAAAILLQGYVWAQGPEAAVQAQGGAGEGQGYLELGGFTNFVNNNFGRWSGGSGKIMYKGERWAPSFGFAAQRRPEGAQATFGVDSYISFNKWFYALAGVGGSPDGSAVLYPKLRYGFSGMLSLPRPRGLVATMGASQVHGEQGAYGRTLTAGAMYYWGRAIWSGSLSFNRSYPGAVPSKSGGLGFQYGTEGRFWIGGGMGGGRIAYQTIALRPLDVRFLTFGPNVFYQQWISRQWGFIVKYDYQNQLDAFQRHGASASIFLEFP